VFDKSKILNKAEEYVPFEKSERFNIVTVCRIDNETKRVDGIVHLCRRLKKEGIVDFKWRIVGNGPSLRQNIKLSKKLDVLDVLEFVGEKKNPYPYILHSDLFALYSAYEGYPMVVGEAIETGTYILTTNYAAATEQIDNAQGIIASSDEDFYQKIKTIINKGKENA
jgi:glycosyltransferase involved in cell wall biosynthesis